MEWNKAYVRGYGLDALDSLLCIGYRIVKETANTSSTLITGHEYRLCSAKADPNYRESIAMLLKEISEAEEYYKVRLVQEGRAMS